MEIQSCCLVRTARQSHRCSLVQSLTNFQSTINRIVFVLDILFCCGQISSAVCFLLSPAASYISGATLRVDAGQSLYHSMWEIPSMLNFVTTCLLHSLFPSIQLCFTLLCVPACLCLDHSAWPESPDGENLDALKDLLNPQSKL